MINTASGPIDATSLAILRAITSTFEKYLVPVLNDPRSQIHAGLILRALQYLESREAGIASATREQAARREDLLRQAVQLLPGSLAPSAEGPAVDDLIALLLQQIRQSSALMVPARDLLHAITQSEFAYFAALDHESHTGGSGSQRGGRAEATNEGGEELLSLRTLQHWVDEAWNADKEVTELVTLPGGFSKTTALLTLKDRATGRDENLVLRRDYPVPLLEQSVVREYPLLMQLHAAGFPVARPICMETRKEFIGGAFMLSERVGGGVDFAVWKNDPQQVNRVMRSFAEVLARLHRYELTPSLRQQIGLSAERLSAHEAMKRQIQRWYDLYRKKTSAEQPLLELAFAWLKSNIPEELKQRHACLLHGDAGLNNLMVNESGEITALLDWEHHHLGDPGEELHYIRIYLDQIRGWDAFVSHYTQAGGVVHLDSTGFYSVWNETRNCVGCVDAAALFESILPSELKLAVAGYVFGPRLQVAAGEKIMKLIDSVSRSGGG